MSDLQAAIKQTVAGHTDLNTFAIVVTILEAGHLYDSSSYDAASRIIRICKTEQARSLRLHDAGIAALKAPRP